jgi:hypothetical protein
MMCHSSRRASRRMALLFPLLLTLSMSFVIALAFAAAVGDHVELQAIREAGVPDGTIATVIDLCQGGRWLHLT